MLHTQHDDNGDECFVGLLVLLFFLAAASAVCFGHAKAFCSVGSLHQGPGLPANLAGVKRLRMHRRPQTPAQDVESQSRAAER